MTLRKTNITIPGIRCFVMAVGLAAGTARAITLYTVAEFPISSDTGGISFFGASGFSPAQTFTALGSGELQSITVALAQNGPLLPDSIVVEFRNSTAGVPDSAIVASAIIDGSLLSGVQPGTPILLSADFSAYHIGPISGTTYAFSLRTDGAGYASVCGSGGLVQNYTGGSLFDSPDSGVTWEAQPLYDMNFQVTAVPEPSMTALVALGGLAILFRRQATSWKIQNMFSPTNQMR